MDFYIVTVSGVNPRSENTNVLTLHGNWPSQKAAEDAAKLEFRRMYGQPLEYKAKARMVPKSELKRYLDEEREPVALGWAKP